MPNSHAKNKGNEQENEVCNAALVSCAVAGAGAAG